MREEKGSALGEQRSMRVVVSINNVRFCVPITDRELTIDWLCGDVAARYEGHLISLGHKLSPKSISIRQPRGNAGSMLDITDKVSVRQGNVRQPDPN
jgi:hypothetical protein